MGLDLVTGGGGYLGSALARALLGQGRRVRILDLRRAPSCPAEADFLEGDIQARDAVRRALEGAERVFHVAFVQSLSKRPEAERYRINVGGMENVLEESPPAGARRIVFASTIEIYGTSPPYPCIEDAPTESPVGWYGRHKLLCEKMLWRFARQTGMPCVALRMPTICGRGFYNHRPLLSLMDRILQDKPVAVMGEGSTAGDFVWLDDVIQGFLLAGEKREAPGEAFNISCKEGASSHLDAVEAMIAAAGSSSKIYHLPAPLVRAGLWAGRLLRLHELPADQDDYLFHPNRYASHKAGRLLGYEPKATAAEAAAALIRGYKEDREFVRQRSRNY